MYTNCYSSRTSHGFTLLEMMIVVIIMAILATIAMPAYQHYITKSYLEEAKSKLDQNYLWLDKMYNKNNGYFTKYNSQDCKNDCIKTDSLPFKESGNSSKGYDFSIAASCTGSSGDVKDVGASTESSFCLLATPKSGQASASGGGKECGTLMIDQSGKHYIKVGNDSPSSKTENNGFKCF